MVLRQALHIPASECRGGSQASTTDTQEMSAGNAGTVPTTTLPSQRATGARLPDPAAAAAAAAGRDAPAVASSGTEGGDISSSVGALVSPLENITLDSSSAENGHGFGHEAESTGASAEQEKAAVQSFLCSW